MRSCITAPGRSLVHVLVLALCTHVGGCAHTASAPDVRLYAIDCGRMLTNGVRASDPCFLIRHPKGDLIWDAGVPESMADAPGGVTRIRNVEITLARKLTDTLAQLKLTPTDIEYFSVSHSHFDHIGNAALFAGSTWIVDADERAWAFRAAARATPAFASYRTLENSPTRLIEGDTDYDVFGDGTVMVIQTPGHTPGHTVLLVRLPKAGAVLLAGDIWNTVENTTARRGSAQELASMEKVDRIAASKRARIVRQHVLEDFEALPHFPDFLQ
jgi:N-acyl homoserine lactone hydrolase